MFATLSARCESWNNNSYTTYYEKARLILNCVMTNIMEKNMISKLQLGLCNK
jgi:hypothetical protein